ncbi:ASCH domain-containing protein [Nonomuraea sp. NPDC049504]|uniref:ASCH domain-containing protein n=1 Tax=Nonomuraea sp. NPDC049504 TaxID=3154729 RepID=UPI003430C0E4
MWPRKDGLRVLELGTPGELRTRLTDLVLSGHKTATAGLLTLDYEAEGEEIEHVGERLALVGDSGERVGEIEITRVEVVPFAEVSWEFANAEGEGYASVAEWGESHVGFWRAYGVEVTDSTPVVCLWFRLL